MKTRAGLVLTGGGARAAYQVGVLKAVRDLLGSPAANPFPIVCGTSAGAINAATLAVFADNFSRAVGNLLEVWENMHCSHIYRTDPWHIMKTGARWLSAMMLISRQNPMSLLDNEPLREMLQRNLQFERIQTHIVPKNINNALAVAQNGGSIYLPPIPLDPSTGNRLPLP